MLTLRQKPIGAGLARTSFLCIVASASPLSIAASFEGIWSTDRSRSEILPDDPGFTPAGREALANIETQVPLLPFGTVTLDAMRFEDGSDVSGEVDALFLSRIVCCGFGIRICRFLFRVRPAD